MTPPLMVRVTPNATVRAWPESPTVRARGGVAVPHRVVPIAEALTRRWPDDAHTYAYEASDDAHGRHRLAVSSVGQTPVRMVWALLDVDDPVAHAATPKIPARAEWWAVERPKLAELRDAHPGVLAYETSRGYRLVGLLATPHVIATQADAEAWRIVVARRLAWLARRWGIVGDWTCHDWTRSYRLPHARRDGQDLALPWHGAPADLGAWPELVDDELAADVAELARLADADPRWDALLRRLRPPAPRGGVGGRGRTRAPVVPTAGDLTRLAPTILRVGEAIAGLRGHRHAALQGVVGALRGSGVHGDGLAQLCDQLGQVPGVLTPDDPHELARLAADLGDRPRRGWTSLRRETPAVAEALAEALAELEPATHGEGDAGADPRDARPVIQLGPDLHRVVAEAVAAVAAHPEVFQRRGVGLVRVLAARDGDPGAPIIDHIPRPVLASMLSASAQWVTPARGGGVRAVAPSEAAVAAVHALGVYQAVRPLRGIVESPTLRRDGSVVTRAGYDAASGLWVHWHGEPLDVPAHPTHEAARDAYAALTELFRDFEFAGDSRARGVALAAIVAAVLSPLAREAIDGPCPAFVFEADAPNAGKTLAASVCGAIATGRIPAVRQHTADDDETAKRLAAIALAGHPVALFDNVRAHVEGGALESALSAHGTIAARLLGRTEDRELPWRTVLYLTMNAASYSADVARRVTHIAMRGREIDLDSPPRFTHPDLLRHVIAHRTDLLRFAFTILIGHARAGRPMPGAVLPTFEAWSRVVAGAVCWASGCDPVRARPPDDANRDGHAARAVTLAWAAAFPNGDALRVGRVLELARLAAGGRAAELGALRDALADLAGVGDPARLTPGSIGKLLASRVVGREMVDPADSRRRWVLLPDGSEHGSTRYRAAEIPETP
jgi:hypothetical protein